MNSLQIIVVAIATLAIFATLAPTFLQAVSADKDCSVGKNVPKSGESISQSAKHGGNGEFFSGVNEFCRSIR